MPYVHLISPIRKLNLPDVHLLSHLYTYFATLKICFSQNPISSLQGTPIVPTQSLGSGIRLLRWSDPRIERVPKVEKVEVFYEKVEQTKKFMFRNFFQVHLFLAFLVAIASLTSIMVVLSLLGWSKHSIGLFRN